MTLCAACNLSTRNDDNIGCTKCRKIYHYKCLRMTKSDFHKKNATADWLCPACCIVTRREKGDHTPVRSSGTNHEAKSPPASSSSWVNTKSRSTVLDDSSLVYVREAENETLTQKDIREIIQSELRSFMSNEIAEVIKQTMNKEWKLIKTELGDIKAEIATMRESMDFINQQYEDFRADASVNTQEICAIQKDNEELRASLKELNNKVDEMELHARASNIEIQGVPEYRSENLVSVVQQLAQIVSCSLKEHDIQMCTRTAKSKPDSARPRNIVVKLSSPLQRDTLLAAVKKFNKDNSTDKLCSKHIGLAGDKKDIFVSEHLSPRNRELHILARQAAKEKQFQFVWIKGGRVFMRKSESSKIFYIRDKESFNII